MRIEFIVLIFLLFMITFWSGYKEEKNVDKK
jgi:hypothetical protein